MKKGTDYSVPGPKSLICLEPSAWTERSVPFFSTLFSLCHRTDRSLATSGTDFSLCSTRAAPVMKAKFLRRATSWLALAGVIAMLAGISIVAARWCLHRGYVLYYGDAEAHLNIARRILLAA